MCWGWWRKKETYTIGATVTALICIRGVARHRILSFGEEGKHPGRTVERGSRGMGDGVSPENHDRFGRCCSAGGQQGRGEEGFGMHVARSGDDG